METSSSLFVFYILTTKVYVYPRKPTQGLVQIGLPKMCVSSVERKGEGVQLVGAALLHFPKTKLFWGATNVYW